MCTQLNQCHLIVYEVKLLIDLVTLSNMHLLTKEKFIAASKLLYIQMFLLVALFTKQLTTSKSLPQQQRYKLFNVKQILPEWTYFSLDRRKNLNLDITLSRTNLYSRHKLNCQKNHRVCLNTLKVFQKDVFLKGNICLELLCNNSNKTTPVIMSSFYNLYLPWLTTSIDPLNLIFPKNFKPSQILCNNAAQALLSINNNGQLKLKKSYKNLIKK